MNLPEKSSKIIEEVLIKSGEYMEMLPNMSAKLCFVARLLATIVAEERDQSEFLNKRIEAIEKRLEACCGRINS